MLVSGIAVKLAGLALAVCLMATGPSFSQDKELAPDISALGPEAAKEFEDTQKFIDQTRSKISVYQAETEARAQEIESLADRVSDIVSSISSKDENNSNLRSEISVLTELLKLERQTTKVLRTDIATVKTALTSAETEHEAQQKKFERALKAKDVARADAELKRDLALESVLSHENTKKVLVDDIELLQMKIERLTKEVTLLKKNRYRSKRRGTRPSTQ